jgi:hypothetical protein
LQPSQMQRDAAKEDYLRTIGVHLLRIPNGLVPGPTTNTESYSTRATDPSPGSYEPPSPQGRGLFIRSESAGQYYKEITGRCISRLVTESLDARLILWYSNMLMRSSGPSQIDRVPTCSSRAKDWNLCVFNRFPPLDTFCTRLEC